MVPSRRTPAVRAESEAPRAPAAPLRELHFCAVCQVSVASAEIERGEARRSPRGRLFCGVCVRSTPQERERRRAELEAEFADDAPVAVPAAPVVEPSARAIPAHEAAFLAARVGELERAAFRMQTRLADLEEKLAEALRRLG